MRFIYHQYLFLYSVIKLFNLKGVNKLILIDFDFTLVKYDFNISKKLDIKNAILNKIIIENFDFYKLSGFVPALFTARGIRSKKFVTSFLDNHLIEFNLNLFLGSTKNKLRFLKFILKFTTIEIILIDDLSDYVESNSTFIAYQIDESLFSYNERFTYIHPNTYEKY